jgi:hypothetical protein
LDYPPPSLFQLKEEGSQTVRREVFDEKRLKRQSVPGRNLSSMWRNLREEMPAEESPLMVMEMAKFRR